MLKYIVPVKNLTASYPHCAFTGNETRWSSVFVMLQWYFNITDSIKLVCKNDDDIGCFLPTDYQHLKIKYLFSGLKLLVSATKALHAKTWTVDWVLYIFDDVFLYSPSITNPLAAHAQIFHALNFENVICKIQENALSFSHILKSKIEKCYRLDVVLCVM